jgi:TFIIF-interacting CTD phosphatase-like protein
MAEHGLGRKIKDNMALTNLKVVHDEPTNQTRAQAAIGSYNVKSNERAISQPVSIRKARHLDIDEVLHRSLPKVAGE